MARNLNPRSFIHTIPMFRYALMLLIGIVIASNSGSVFGLREWVVAVCLLVGAALLVNKRHEMTSSVLLLLAIVGVGGMRYSFHAKDAWAVTDDQHCRLGMNIASEPIRRGKVIQFEGIVNDVSAVSNSPVSGDGGQDVSCRMKGRRLYISLLRDTITRKYEALHIGQAIIADVDVSPLKDWHRINSHFDYIRWQKMRGIVGRGFVGIGKWEVSAAGFSALGFWETLKLRALVFRQRILERIKTVMPGDAAYAVLTAMALGNKSSLTPELREEYSISGASHILALSGMHLSIIYMLLSFFIRDRKLLYRLLIFIGLWGYVVFVGMPLSVVRAASMLTIWEAVWLAGREQRPLNVFGATLAIMLMSNPESLWDVGFQMSFMAVFAIIVTRPLSQQLMPMSLRLMRKPEEMVLPLWKRTRNKMSRGLWYTA
ncbi:MAG: ComEC/Rec2 family competence protein, partial [Prevotella sp.]|nr:ComEC/Rec2 family competence protein [Prevotella sp.]